MAKISQTIAAVAIASYGAALALEWWRPGFVTYFWNPQILVPIAIVGMALAARAREPERRAWRSIVFFLALAIVGALLIWRIFPPSATRYLATGAVLVLAFAFVSGTKKFTS
ncbi:hypothetical protein HY478_04155 [Candidatus Uhrbacteria bacterium]|nr:hypothetical protein [Candidatus Uhrbacteria bacterium]